MAWSHSPFADPPSFPKAPIINILRLWATWIALRILGDFPLVLKTIKTSPFWPNASTCLENTSSYDQSFAIQVRAEPSAQRARAGSALRFPRYRPVISSAKCIESAALPPFPQVRTLPPALTLSANARPAASTAGTRARNRWMVTSKAERSWARFIRML